MTPSLVREEPDEVESLTSGFEAESGEAIPRLRLTRGQYRDDFKADRGIYQLWSLPNIVERNRSQKGLTETI